MHARHHHSHHHHHHRCHHHPSPLLRSFAPPDKSSPLPSPSHACMGKRTESTPPLWAKPTEGIPSPPPPTKHTHTRSDRAARREGEWRCGWPTGPSPTTETRDHGERAADAIQVSWETAESRASVSDDMTENEHTLGGDPLWVRFVAPGGRS